MAVPSFGTDLAILIGLGVGVDYGLFIISRHRSAVKAGMSYEDAAAQAVNTSGRTVLFAGLTVCIALLGQFALGVGFLYGLSVVGGHRRGLDHGHLADPPAGHARVPRAEGALPPRAESVGTGA